MTDPADLFRDSAANLARAVAGEDNARFTLVFQTLMNQATSFANSEDPVGLAKASMRRASARTRSSHPLGSPPPAEGIYTDPVYLENASAMAVDQKRIVGGVQTKDFEDCVAVGSANGWCCSGTVIAPEVVLTAAHCVDGGCGSRVFVGPNVKFPDTGEVVDVRSAIMHPDYQIFEAPADIAVLILAKPVKVMPRKVAPVDALDGVTYVRVVGFGNTNTQGTRGYGRRRVVDVPLAGTSKAYDAHFTTEFVAGAPFLDVDSCSGDSGGPAYVWLEDEWFVAGATSRAVGHDVRPCGDGGVYTRVAEYETWIRSVIGEF